MTERRKSSFAKIFFLAVLFLASSCRQGEFTVDDLADGVTSTTITYATFGGWTQIKAVGAKTPAAQGSDLTAGTTSVTLTWSAMTPTTGTIASYSIYRSTSSGGQDSAFPLSSNISTSTRTYTDSSVTAGTTYYYLVAAVLTDGTIALPALTNSDREVKVVVPPVNMVLMHRWAANYEMCTTMGRTIDRNNNYRCAVNTGATAPPGTDGSGYVDIGQSLLIDAYEQGCNYTATNACTDATVNGGAASPCVGIRSSPNANVTAAAGSIYYSRVGGICYINTSAGNGTTWTAANSTTAVNRQTMGSAAPGLPPFTNISQTSAKDVCAGQTVTGATGTKRLPKHREQVLMSVWDSSLSDATIDTMENGVNLNTTHNCNTNYSSPQGNNTTDISGTTPSMAFDNAVTPTAKDTLPGCRNGDCAATGVAIRSLRTGSDATSSCVSRYGVQDYVGNVWEWATDQILCDNVKCTGVTGGANTVDTTNTDWAGTLFDGTQGPTATGTFTSFGKVQLPAGIPIAGAGFTGDGVVSMTAAQFHSDSLFLTNVGAGTRGAMGGGSWSFDGRAGRFALHLFTAPTINTNIIGFRCAIAAD